MGGEQFDEPESSTSVAATFRMRNIFRFRSIITQPKAPLCRIMTCGYSSWSRAFTPLIIIPLLSPLVKGDKVGDLYFE